MDRWDICCAFFSIGVIVVKCFGTFEVYAKGEKLTFKRSKTKELFAFLVDRNGAGVTVAEIGVALWENDEEQKNQNYIHQLFRDLRQTLEAIGMEEIFERNNYLYSVNPEKIDCDYYSYLKTGKPGFIGEYMSQYSWAEETCGLLWEPFHRIAYVNAGPEYFIQRLMRHTPNKISFIIVKIWL